MPLVASRNHREVASGIRALPVTFLIDGYNLLHAVGLATRNLPAKSFERARTRLLDWLADCTKDRTELLRVVFDAQKSPTPSLETNHRGVKVRFAFRQTADELIEELIRDEHHPEKTTVVSNDHQVQDSGRHRGCAVSTCQEFVDWLIAIPKESGRALGAPEPEKIEEHASSEEMTAWLEAFSKPPGKNKR